jgi:hypothetical protein
MDNSWNPWRWLSTLTDIQEDFLMIGTFVLVILIILLVWFKGIRIKTGEKEVDIGGTPNKIESQKTEEIKK